MNILRSAVLGAVFGLGFAAAAGPDAAVQRRLTAEAVQLRGRYVAALAVELRQDQREITPAELGLLSRLARSPGVAFLVYFDRRGGVRWADDPQFLALPMAAFEQRAGVALPAAAQVMRSTEPFVRQVPDTPFYEVAVPLLADGAAAGVLDLWVRRDGLFWLLAERPHVTEAPRASAAPATATALPEDVRRRAQKLYVAGMVFFEKGDYEQARQQWEQAHALDPEDRDVAAGLSRVRRLLGQPSGVEGRIPTEEQRLAQERYLAGVAAYEKGDFVKARQEWSAALGWDPDHADAAAALARVDRFVAPDEAKSCVTLFQAGRHDDAATACAACLERDPQSAACAATLRLLEERIP